LSDEFLVDDRVRRGTCEGLFEEGEEYGGDDCYLQRLPEDDEEDGDGEDLFGHLDGRVVN
jgi:hypothetical protein